MTFCASARFAGDGSLKTARNYSIRVERMKLKPALRYEWSALHVEGKREGGRSTARDELLLRMEEAHAELLEERVGAEREVRGVLRIDDDRSRAPGAAGRARSRTHP